MFKEINICPAANFNLNMSLKFNHFVFICFAEFGSTHGSQMYEFWVHCMFLVLVPVVSIFILNMLIIRQVRNVNRNMESKRGEAGKTKARKSEAQMTKLLLTVTFTFLVLIAFQCIVQCFFMLKTVSPDLLIKMNK